MLALALATIACGKGTTASTLTPTSTSPVTETLTTSVAPSGGSFRNFTVPAAGSVSVTLMSTNPPGIVLGLGIGVPNSTGTVCNLTFSLRATGSDTAQLTSSVDPGGYCAGVYDVGTVGDGGVGFTVRIVHP